MPAKQTLDLLIGTDSNAVTFSKSQIIFRQGDTADSVFYIEEGNVKLTVVSETGKEAIVGILTDGDFFGEDALSSQPLRIKSATAMTYCRVLRIQKDAMMLALHRQPELTDLFIACVLARTLRYEQDLIDHLLNSSEKRLARVLLLLAQFGEDDKSGIVIRNISQGTLAEMVGTTRSRINFFMNRFRASGFLDYGQNGIQVHRSLLNVVLED